MHRWILIAVPLAVVLFGGFFNSVPAARGQSAAAAQAFEEGNRRYAADDYEAAIPPYREALATGYVSGALYYNLASAYYRTGATGQAVRYYEKARTLLPESEALQHSLQAARNRAGAPPPLPSSGLSPWQRVRSLMSPKALFAGGLAAYLIALALLGKQIWNEKSRPSSTRAMAFLFAAGVLCIGIAFAASAPTSTSDRAVTLAGPLTLRQTPSPDADSTNAVPEGTVLHVLSRRSAWAKVRSSEGPAGWLKADALGDI